jgi:signal transduction histidine kinase
MFDMYNISDKLKEMGNNRDEGKANGPVHYNSNLNMLTNPKILTGMSHEMRTHMNAIVAFSFLMSNKESESEERIEFSNHIINSCEQLLILFDNFLDSAIIDTGKPVNEVRKCDLNELLHELVTEFRALIPRYNHKSIELIVDDKGIRSGEVYIDIHKVSRVIRNLFLNALESTNNGYIRIGYNLDSEKVTFYILDSGQSFQRSSNLLIGRNEGDNESYFNNYTQSAISLFLSKKLISLMNGDLWIEQNGITGSGIYFSIPVKEIAGNVGSPGKKEFKSKLVL